MIFVNYLMVFNVFTVKIDKNDRKFVENCRILSNFVEFDSFYKIFWWVRAALVFQTPRKKK